MWVGKLEWDPGNYAEVDAARATFRSYTAKGYLALHVGAKEAVVPQQFEPTLGAIEFHTRPTLFEQMMEDDDDADAG